MIPKNEQYLPPEAIKAIRREVIPLFKANLTARRLLPVVNVDRRTREHGYDFQQEDNSQDAEIVFPGGTIPRDTPDGRKRITAPIVKPARGYEIPYEDYINEQWMNRTIDLVTRKVSELDDDIIINGSHKANIPGLIDVPASTVSRQNDVWTDSSDTGGTPFEDIINMLNTLRTQSNKAFGKNPGGLSIVMDPLSESTLYLTHKAESYKGQLTYERLSKLFGQIVVVPSMPDGTVIMMETGRHVGELIIAQDITVGQAQYVVDNDSYAGNILERVKPTWYQHGPTAEESTAIVKLENTLENTVG